MTKLNRLVAAVALATATLTAAVAQAHGIWFAQRATKLALIYGVGADDLDSVKRLPKITGVSAFDADGKQVPTKLAADGLLALVDTEANPAVVAATMDNGMWSKTPDGKWHAKGRDEVPDAITSEHTYKYAVHIRSALNGPLQPIPGHVLQIVPVDKAIPEKMGQPLKLRVLHNGKPVRGAKILTDWVNDPDAKPLKTAANGTITVKVRNQGLNVITAILETPPNDPAKTKIVEHLATLSFVLPHLPE